MSNSNNLNTGKTLTAAQRIDAIQDTLGKTDQTIFNLTRQMQLLQDALTLLNDKVAAIVVALSSGQAVTEQAIDEINTDRKVSEMKEKVEKLVSQGVMSKSEAVTKNSFLVVREINTENGKVINPRLQFIARILNQESLDKVLGKKVGDSVKFVDENPAVIEIEEVYEITNKNADASSSEKSDSLPQEEKAATSEQELQ